jgi:hypothetical protein
MKTSFMQRKGDTVLKNPLLLIALILTGLIAIWGIIDTAGLAQFSSTLTGVLFTSRGWFVMLSVSLLLILCIWLAISPYGKIKLGKDDDEPEFSTVSWLTMLFAAGMGVGLLFWGTAEPLSHFNLISKYTNSFDAAGSQSLDVFFADLGAMKSNGEITNRPPAYTSSTLGGLWRMRGFPSQRFNDKAAIYYAAELRLIPEWNPFNNWPRVQK